MSTKAVNFISELWEITFLAACGIARFIWGYTGPFFAFIWGKTEKFRMTVWERLSGLLFLISAPFLNIYHVFHKIKRDVQSAQPSTDGTAVPEKEKTKWFNISLAIPHLRKYIFGKTGLAVSLFNIIVPVISFAFLIGVVNYAKTINYGVRLNVNEVFLGYIENEQVFNDAEIIAERRLESLGSRRKLEINPKFSLAITDKKEYLNPYQVADIIMNNSGVKVEYAYGVFVNGKLVGAVKDNTPIKKALNDILEKYRQEDDASKDEEVKFVWDINDEQGGLYTAESIVNPQEIVNLFNQKKSEAKYYTVQDGDSQTLIGDKLNLTQSELEAMNPGFSKMSLHSGDKIKYQTDVPYLDVSITRTISQNISIPYTTSYKDDPVHYAGTVSTDKEGEYGINEVTAKVTYINGVETNRETVKFVRIKEPVTKIVLRGTKPTPAGTFSGESSTRGKFIWPIKHGTGYISEKGWWDGGYPGHKGVDFAAKQGTPIYAGANGTVTFSGYRTNGYGNYIIIDHPQYGLQTLYGHCSVLYVRAGEKVTQGQCIGLVGETGNAQGSHVHFEVRQGNTNFNPMHYID